MAKLFTRIYCEDAVLNVPGHIETDVEVNEAVFYEGTELKATVLNVLENKGVCIVKIFYFRYLDFPDAPEEPATEEDLITIDSSFLFLRNEKYIVCDNECVVSMIYWVETDGQVKCKKDLKEFGEVEDTDTVEGTKKEDSVFVDFLD